MAYPFLVARLWPQGTEKPVNGVSGSYGNRQGDNLKMDVD